MFLSTELPKNQISMKITEKYPFKFPQFSSFSFIIAFENHFAYLMDHFSLKISQGTKILGCLRN